MTATKYRFACAIGLAAGLSMVGCSPSEILDVTDPDIVEPDQVSSAEAAIGLRNGVFLRLSQAVTGTQGPDALFLIGGMVADEWRSGDTFVQRNNADQRIFDPQNTFHPGPYRALNRVRVEGERAVTALRQYLPDSVAAVGSMFAVTALVETLISEHYCNGSPLSNVEGTEPVYGNPLTNQEVLQLAVEAADSALANSGGNANVQRLAAIVKGRALLNLGQFAAAATAVTGVPLTHRFEVSHSLNTNSNQIWGLNVNARRYTMVNGEGGVGLDYVLSNDPRLPKRTGGASVFDSAYPTTLYRIGIWDRTTALAVATGIEAELIRAEADLQAGLNASWLNRINALRTNTSLYPPIPAGLGSSYVRGANLTNLADPGNQPARVDIMFRERAFWMFSTGHRLGDMRRLVRQYGRAVDTVFPTGGYYKGGSYGAAVNIPVAFDEQNNPNFTECLDRNP